MGRIAKVNEIVARTLNEILRTVYRETATFMTITKANVSPDLRDAYIYYSVIGGEEIQEKIKKFLTKNSGEIRCLLMKKVVLKYSPKLSFRLDDSIEYATKMVDILDNL